MTKIYPEIRAELESVFGWTLNIKPSILLIKDSEILKRAAVNPLTVAFAVPDRNVIVIDYSRMNVYPLSLPAILKHELCHLMLHHHINRSVLPRWLDEGICQWASDGIADIIMDQKRSYLNRAALRGVFIRLDALQKEFPYEKELHLLAYEESKDIVIYIIKNYGKKAMFKTLGHMKDGKNVNTAFLEGLSISVNDLEKKWHNSLRQKLTWFAYFSYHLYDILFALMGLIMIWAAVKIILRKRDDMETLE